MHMYTHDGLWPAMMDVAQSVGSQCTLLAECSGGHPFDESMSGPWARLQSAFPTHPLRMACHAATLELRGESEVEDALALRDAAAIYNVLVGRGYVRDPAFAASFAPPKSCLDASPLAGVDMIEVSSTRDLCVCRYAAAVMMRGLCTVNTEQ